MQNKILFIMIIAITSQQSLAQRIKSNAYNATLSSMLSHDVPEISVVDAAKLQGKVTFLDSRETPEFAVSSIPGAIWVGYKDFDLKRVSGLDEKRQIIVYCSVGFRSEKITQKLIKAGFTNVSNLYGGIFEWVNRGHGVVNTKGSTQHLHAFSKFWGMWLDKGQKVYK